MVSILGHIDMMQLLFDAGLALLASARRFFFGVHNVRVGTVRT